MGKSWHLTVNEPLYSAGHLSRDQGLSLIWAPSLKHRVWVRLMSLGTQHLAPIRVSAIVFHCIFSLGILQSLSFDYDLTLQGREAA